MAEKKGIAAETEAEAEAEEDWAMAWRQRSATTAAKDMLVVATDESIDPVPRIPALTVGTGSDGAQGAGRLRTGRELKLGVAKVGGRPGGGGGGDRSRDGLGSDCDSNS